MKSYEIYTCRRKALRITRLELANEIGCNVSYIEDFENGTPIPQWYYERIKWAIRNRFNSLSPVEHYRVKILELGIELRDETSTQYALEEIAHMMVELGKLQNELLGNTPKTKEDWET